MKRERLLRSKDYIVAKMQLALLNLIGDYKDKKKLKDYELAKQLGVSKGYVSQILNATYDHKLSKVADLALATNNIPLLFFVDVDKFIKDDAENKFYELWAMPKNEDILFSPSKSKSPSYSSLGFTIKGDTFSSVVNS